MESYPEPSHKQTRPIPPHPNVPIITSGPSRAVDGGRANHADAMVSSPLIAHTKDHLSSGLTTTLDHIVGQVVVMISTLL